MDSQEARERMREGRLYPPGDEKIVREQALWLEKLYDFNATRPGEGEKRREMMKKMFAQVGENCYIEPPLHANWGGKNVFLGNNVYANFGWTLVDDGEIRIGDNCMFGPNVILVTAGHPVEPGLRAQGMQFNDRIVIGNNVWLGAGVTVLPGVTIGDNAVIGAASVVTKDVPAGVVAVGNPCRVLREIGDRDRKYYFKDREIDL